MRDNKKDDEVLKKPTGVFYKRIADGSLAIMPPDQDHDCFFLLDGVAADFWLLVDGKSPTSQIRRKIEEKYQPDIVVFDDKFKKLIKDLRRQNLLSPAKPSL